MEKGITKSIIAYLGCPCQGFQTGADIMAAYREARARGEKEGFIPVLVAAEDETLLECLEINLEDSGKTAEEYRRGMLAAPIEDGEAYFASLLATRKEEAEEDGFVWMEDVLGQQNGGEAMDGFYGMDEPMLLAEIPVKHPWEVFAYLPFGGWNECPDTAGLMSASKYWYEKYGAVPAVVTHDVLEFYLPVPAGQQQMSPQAARIWKLLRFWKADGAWLFVSCVEWFWKRFHLPIPTERGQMMHLALEQYAWCPDIVDQGCETVEALADTLTKSTVWYFWWD